MDMVSLLYATHPDPIIVAHVGQRMASIGGPECPGWMTMAGHRLAGELEDFNQWEAE